jgi:RNAse (barnase) inhibitor barstar
MKRPIRKRLDDLPRQGVVPLGGWTTAQLGEWARAREYRFTVVDLSGCEDKPSAMRRLGSALELPSWFGANLDALYDSLTDDETWSVGHGAVIVLDRMPDAQRFGAAEREALLGVFREVAEHYAERGTPFHVFYR